MAARSSLDNACPMDTTAIFAANLQRLRIAAGLSRMELARRVPISDIYLGQLERGTKSPTLLTVAAVAEAFGVEPEQLLHRHT